MKFSNLIACAAALSVSFMTAGCSSLLSSTSFTRDISYTDTGVHRPDEFPILHATGYALISRQPGKTEAEREIMAMRASKIEAYRELTEQVNGLYLKSATVLSGNTRQVRDSVSTEVEGFVHGARVIRQYPAGDTYATELELDTKIIYDLYDIRGAL
ncbi:MAG: hypothetical protein SPL30_06170 [Succinivibrio sp.]|jgi:hypothetical protein|nr:hypothetical protein [Succinivibrio sp.]